MEKKVHFYSGPGLRLAGILELPETRGKTSGIVLCHAGTGTKEALLPEVSKWLSAHGYAVLRFDYRGVGESQGPECQLIPLEQVEDIRSAITFMQQQKEVNAERIGLWGPSSGAANANYTAGTDSRVKCLVSVSGIGDMGRWLQAMRRYWEWKYFLGLITQDRSKRALTGESQRVPTAEIVLPAPDSGMDTLPAPKSPAVQNNDLTLASAEAMISFRPEAVVHRISPRAGLWICTSEDIVIPVEASQALYRRAGEPKKLVTMSGFKHYELYHGPGFEQVMRHSVSWFDEHLASALQEDS